MASDLTRGAITGAQTFFFFNSATHAAQTWVEIKRARNVVINRGPTLTDVEMHGAAEVGSTPGYQKTGGSFEYVKRAGVDTVWNALVAARENRRPIELAQLDGPINDGDSKGWQCPVYLGEFGEPANGNDIVVVSIPWMKADVHDADGNPVNYAPFSGTTP